MGPWRFLQYNKPDIDERPYHATRYDAASTCIAVFLVVSPEHVGFYLTNIPKSREFPARRCLISCVIIESDSCTVLTPWQRACVDEVQTSIDSLL